MDKNIEILLGSTKNVESINVDNFERVELTFKPSLLLEYDVRNILSVAEYFNTERNATPVYRIYGGLEYFSILNGLKTTYQVLDDFFSGDMGNDHKNVYNSFDFYLVRPSSSGYTEINYTGETDTTIEWIKNENFKSWNQEGTLPIGWELGDVYGDAVLSEYTRRDISLGARFAMGTYGVSVSTIEIYTDISLTHGEFVLEVYSTTPTPNGTEKLEVFLYDENDNSVYSIDTLATGNGEKKYNVSIPSTTPINKIGIKATGADLNIYVFYLKFYKLLTLDADAYSWDAQIRKFEIIATPNDFEIYKMGFAKNVFNEEKYGFIFNKDIDISNYFDALGFPITEIYLYAKYIPSGEEDYYYTVWNENGASSKVLVPSQTTLTVYGDLITYTKDIYEQNELEPQIHYIHTPYTGGRLVWKYNPFLPLRLQYLSNQVSRANSGTTVYDAAISIPDYATLLDVDGNYVWREILDQGYIDPLSGDGVDYPFVNKRRYLFSNLILTIVPDLDDGNTNVVFGNLRLGSETLNVKPLGDLDNIGKPCQ